MLNISHSALKYVKDFLYAVPINEGYESELYVSYKEYDRPRTPMQWQGSTYKYLAYHN